MKSVIAAAIIALPIGVAALPVQPASAQVFDIKIRPQKERVIYTSPGVRGANYGYPGVRGSERRVWTDRQWVPGHWEYTRYGRRWVQGYWIPGRYDYRW